MHLIKTFAFSHLPQKTVQNPQHLTREEVLTLLDANEEQGLNADQVVERRGRFGLNVISATKPRSPWTIFISQFRNAIVILLVVATVVSLVFGDFAEAAAITAVIFLNAIIGFALELQANRSMTALKALDQPLIKVFRGGFWQRVSIDQVVPGDIISFEAGDLVGADARLLKSVALEVNESVLTGESVPVDKMPDEIPGGTQLGDQRNMVFRGTSVTKGNGLAVVVATGRNTEIGRIATMVDQAQAEEIPLNRKLNHFSKTLIWLTIFIMVPFVTFGLLQDREVYLMIETAIALAVAAIPEGLPIVATIALARGMLKLSKKKVIVKKLAAVETLGSTDIILADKTGTLTENKLAVMVAVGAEGEGLATSRLYEIAVLCNNAELNQNREVGDPVEVALLRWAEKQGEGFILSTRKKWVKQVEEPFDSDVRMMTTVHQSDSELMLSVKGATAEVLKQCAYYEKQGSLCAMDGATRQYWVSETTRLSRSGLKVLAFAYKTPGKVSLEVNNDLVMVGLLGLQDPPRVEVSSAISECQSAGIKVIMVTGDHPETAKAIAHDIGLVHEREPEVVHGRDLRFDHGEGQEESLKETSIYSRVTPEQKLRLVEYYQSKGHVVAMTGDGVNDAPALKKAQIGVAMGLRGTEVAKEAADMALQDDSFLSIVAAIKQGRIIFNNIRNFVIYLLSCNLSEILIVSIGAFLHQEVLLLPLQILFLNLVTDVFPALALGMGQGSEKMIMQPPRGLSEPVLTRSHWKSLISYAMIITTGVLGAFFYATEIAGCLPAEANNIAFFTLAFAQLVHPFNLIGRGESLFKNEIARNPHLWAAIALCTFILLGAGTIHPLDELLAIQAISGGLWWVIVAGSLFPLLIVHLLKRTGVLQ